MAGFTGRWTGQRQPMATTPQPDPRHADKTPAPTAWDAPPAGTGQGAPFAQPTDPPMTARGIGRDPAWRYGHRGTATTREAFTPHNGVSGVHARNAAQAASARAHADTSTTRVTRHVYGPQPEGTAGESRAMDTVDGHPGPTTGARTVWHSRPGGQFSDGPTGDVGPTGFRLGVSRRWAQVRYSSPALGAMYSKNSLRGILPQTISTPHNQPALPGPINSGIPSNARFLAKAFTRPRIFKTPTPDSDVWAAQQPPDTGLSPVLGIGVM